MLEKLLDSQYKWWYQFWYAFRHNTAYRGSTILWMVGRLLFLTMTIFIWWINIENGSSLFEFKEIFTYYIFGTMIGFGHGVHWNVSESIRYGSITKKLIRPVPFMKQAIISDAGWWVFPTMVEFSLLAAAAIIGHQYILFASWLNMLLYVVCGIIGYFCSLFFAFIIGTTAFYLTDSQGVMDIQQQLEFVMSGKALPLSVAPFLVPLQYSPFAFIFYHPMQIFLGNYTIQQSLLVIAGGCAWAIVLYIIAKTCFKIGLKRNESVGL